MKEYIEHSPLGGQHVVLSWQETPYKIPFIVLESICDSWRISRQHKNRFGLVIQHGDHVALRNWLNQPQDYFKSPESIYDLKQIIECEMPDMRAFIMY